MKKSDLKTGMLVVTRTGEMALVMLNNCCGEDAVIFNDDNWTPLKNFTNDLIWYGHEIDRNDFCKTVDIMKVYVPDLPTECLTRNVNRLKLLWERKEVPEYTMEELTRKLGHEFKIKK